MCCQYDTVDHEERRECDEPDDDPAPRSTTPTNNAKSINAMIEATIKMIKETIMIQRRATAQAQAVTIMATNVAAA